MLDPKIKLLGEALKLRNLEQRIISQNIIHSNTPNYTAQGIDFESELGRSLRQSSIESPNSLVSSPRVFSLSDYPRGLDGNNVDLEKEMSKLFENQLQYRSYIQFLNKKIAALKYAISEGRG